MKDLYRFGFVFLVAAFLVAGSSVAVCQARSAKGAQKASAHAAVTTNRKAHPPAKAEKITGTVSKLGNEGELLTLTAANGVPYDFIVTRHTQIKIAGKSAKLADLKDQVNKQAGIEFVPMSNGNLAKAVDVS
jgi:hypothetical protein